MARYRFHCTNGSECVFDGYGQEIRRPEQLASHAHQVAYAVMSRPGPERGWSGWRVSVHDLSGQQVLVQPFPIRSEPIHALAA